MKNIVKAFIIFIATAVLGVIIFNFIVLPLWTGFRNEVQTPDVCGKRIDEAQKLLKKVGIVPEIKAEKFSAVPEGIVIYQNPLPNRWVKKGRIIELTISRGKEKTRIPWVYKLDVQQAIQAIENANLTIGEIIYEYSDEVPPESVIGTQPSMEKIVQKGAKINLIVSKGSEELKLPDLMWKTLKEAKEEAAKLNLFIKTKFISTPSELGIVIDQQPSPGTNVHQKDTIQLIVGSPR